MKKNLSVFSMIARHSIFKVFLLLFMLVLANTMVFNRSLGQGITGIHNELDRPQLLIVFFVVYLLFTIVLCAAMCDRGGHQNYFLDRLNVSGKRIYFSHVLYNTFCYVLLLGVETLCLLGLCVYAGYRFSELLNHQTIMLASYISNFLHTFFPVSDILGWVTNGMMILGLGFCTAAFPTRNRGGKQSITTVFMCAIAAGYIFLQSENGALTVDFKIITIIASVIFMLSSSLGVLSREVTEDV